ncbi:hypothetical protein DEM27_10390 [Metarhizobium album]|uniref:DUF4214 domain-containing protein n=1 Tax=Metarhizobium album TaxID=2182425 RepID=A0A2U2DTY2_9HYPH|nr:DUF4214 domain-containing protein [Rhizobium album]PWE56762.1 hypothetical protein DEM27_10390 [Rhizobium album]
MATAVGNTDVYSAYKSALGRAPSAAEMDYWKSSGYDASNVKKAIYDAGASERTTSGYKAPTYSAPKETDRFYNDYGVLKNNPGFTGMKDTSAKAEVPQAVQASSGWNYTRRDDDVQNNLMRLMDPESPLMRQATTAGLRTANRRGLLNSSIAASAVQDSAYTAAVPLASQNASQAAQENLTNIGYDAQMRMQERQLGSAAALQAAQIKATADLQTQDIGYQTAERKLDRALQEKLAGWNLNSSDRNSAASTLLGMEQLYNTQVQNIMNNTNLSAADRTAYLASANAYRDKVLSLVEQMYDVSLDWGQNSAAAVSEAEARSFVQSVYQSALKREATNADLNYWVARLLGGTPKATIEAEIKSFQ